MKKIKAFISYSRKDKKYFKEFIIHLKGLERICEITHWYDGAILPGENIDKTISDNLSDSDLVFLLISPNYIQSYYCFEKELKDAFLNCSKGKCIVIPVLINRISNFNQFEFSKYKTLPTDTRPVASFKPISDGFTCVMNEVFVLVQQFVNKTTVRKESSNKQKELTQNKFYYSVVVSGKITKKSFNSELYFELQSYMNKMEILEKRLTSHLVNSIVDFQNQFETEKQKKVYVKWHSANLQAYTLQLLEYAKKILDNNIFALHIRWLKKKSFVSFVDAGYKENPFLSVHTLPEDDPMITSAYALNMPIIKSLNTQLHKTNHNDEKNQRDYITCAFSTIKLIKQEELSLCISCEKSQPIMSRNQLLIMAFCRIDKKIEAFLLSYIEACTKIDKRYSLKKIGDTL